YELRSRCVCRRRCRSCSGRSRCRASRWIRDELVTLPAALPFARSFAENIGARDRLRRGGDLRGAARQGGGHVQLLCWAIRLIAAIAKTEYRGQDAYRGQLVETASRQPMDVQIDQRRACAERQIVRRTVEFVFVLDKHPDQFFVHKTVPPETGVVTNSRWCRRR